MKTQESHRKTAVTANAEKVDASDKLVVTSGERQNGDVFKQYQNREDLEKAYNKAKVSEAQLADSEARLRTIIDMVPSFLWTSRPDGSKEYLNQRRFSNTPALRRMTSSRKVFTPKNCIRMTWNDRLNKGKRDSNVANLLKANIAWSGRMVGIVGSSFDTTHSAIKRATLFAGTQRQP